MHSSKKNYIYHLVGFLNTKKLHLFAYRINIYIYIIKNNNIKKNLLLDSVNFLLINDHDML